MKMLYNETMEVTSFINRLADSLSQVAWDFFLEKTMFEFSLEENEY